MSILWLIICIVQVVVALIAWLIWYIIRKGVEEHCYQGSDSCLCSGLDKSVPIPGKSLFLFIPMVVTAKIHKNSFLKNP